MTIFSTQTVITSRAFLATSALVLLYALAAGACVETAECDLNIRCPSGQTCHQPKGSDSPGFCQKSCTSDEECDQSDDDNPESCVCSGEDCDQATEAKPLPSGVGVCVVPWICEPKCDDHPTDGSEDCREGRCQPRE